MRKPIRPKSWSICRSRFDIRYEGAATAFSGCAPRFPRCLRPPAFGHGKVKADLDLRNSKFFTGSPNSKAFPKPPSCSRCASPPSARMFRNWKRLRRQAVLSHARPGQFDATGRLLAEHAKILLAFKREMRAAVEQFHGTLSGELWVGGSSIPGEYLLPPSSARSRKNIPRQTDSAHSRFRRDHRRSCSTAKSS